MAYRSEMQPNALFDELLDLVAQGGGPEAVIAFRPSVEASNRAYDLMYKERDGVMTPEEKRELDWCMDMEHFMRMMKIRARLLLREREKPPHKPK